MSGLTEEEILSRGVIKNVPLVLGDSEDRGPAGHWLNTSGSRVYTKARVLQAEELLKTKSGSHFVSENAEQLNASQHPTTPAIYIFDYRTILKSLDQGLAHQIWKERLSHPRAGRLPGSADREVQLIEKALLLIAAHAFPVVPFNAWQDFQLHLEELALNAHSIFLPAWPRVTTRRATLRYNVSRGLSAGAARKVLSVFALIQSGRLNYQLISADPISLPKLLVRFPVIRIDHEIIEPSDV